MTNMSSEVAIVTGAAQGVGLAVVKLLCARKMRVVLSDVNVEAGTAAATEINQEHGEGAATFIACDLSKTQDIESLIADTVSRFGGFSILVNNAGFLRAPFLAISAEDIKDTIAINLTAVVHSTQLAIKFWDEHPEIKGQAISVTSSSSFKTYASIAAYGAAKAGAAQFTFACRAFGPRIRVNAVAPTAIATAFDKNTMMRVPTERTGPGYTPEEEMRNMGLARLQPEDVARAVVECIDDESRFGKVVYLDATEGQKIRGGFLGED
ncbi:3-oxoacyl-reductase 1 [Emericellopsis atlantica]|uniref:3-oxoacyl-reductase 1 n=1 Tax=Emericellopsis atlantica TaxID=2614577 RepID=A0A9P7ZCC3_9HYPO|nr:3-oxoacyl-reductase 1 [Emericellopsis atlantica]KAG9249489.1 3-oxoacyl-reductase 1 [Emericellopsis atlantica]